MYRRTYTKQDYEILKAKFLRFEDRLDGIYVVTKVENPTYKHDTRSNPQHKSAFDLRYKGYRITFLKDVVVLALQSGYDPLKLMLELHNYGVAQHKYVTAKNNDIFVEAAKMFVKKDPDIKELYLRTLGELKDGEE
jgi:hypothetical protein